MKALLIIVGIIVIALVAWLVISGLDTEETTNTVSNTSTTNSSTSSQVPAPGSNVNETVVQQGQGVSITSSGFEPKTVTINAGETVTWTNEDSASHQVTPDDHPTHTKYAGIWDDSAVVLRQGETYEQLFMTAGTYTYHDHLNISRTGTVIVE